MKKSKPKSKDFISSGKAFAENKKQKETEKRNAKAQAKPQTPTEKLFGKAFINPRPKNDDDTPPPKRGVTFSKSLDKWEQGEAPSFKPNYVNKDERRRNNKDNKQGLKRFMKDEGEHEKVYAASPTKGKNHQNDTTPPIREIKDTEQMPLNKFIAHCDVCSRRDAALLIKEGKVKVNNELVTEPGFKVTNKDLVTVSGKKLFLQKNLIYILLNKPKGYITTTDDPKGRRTVLDIFSHHIEERIFPIGRLDRNTTGVLLLTNDGQLAQKLSHPKYEINKVYKATLNKNLSQTDFNKIKEGLELEDGPVQVDQIEFLDTKNEIGIEIHSGKNRIVRRIFESLGYEVEKLDRVMYAGLSKKNVERGKWRFLNKQEIINLKFLNKTR